MTDTPTSGGGRAAGDPGGGGLRKSWRLAAAGALVALACLPAGWGLEGLRYGWTDAAATAKVEREVRARLDRMMVSLRQIADQVAARPDLIQPVADNTEAARRLFELLAQTVDDLAPGEAAATVYGPSGVARAWTGRPAEIPQERIAGGEAYFVVPSPLGLRLFYVQPVMGAAGRLGTIRGRASVVAAD